MESICGLSRHLWQSFTPEKYPLRTYIRILSLIQSYILFPGHSNNEMLKLHMELKGAFPKKLLRKAAFRAHHFDESGNFLSQDLDAITKKPIMRIISGIFLIGSFLSPLSFENYEIFERQRIYKIT